MQVGNANHPSITPKVVYLLLRLNLAETPLLGIRKKILGQIRAFQAAGFESTIVDTPSVLPTLYGRQQHDSHAMRATTPSLVKWLIQKARNFSRNVRNALEVLQKLKNSGKTYLYVRHTSATPGLILFHLVIRTLPNVQRVYLEVPTWPYRHEHYVRTSDRIFWPMMGYLVHRVVTFSSDKNILGVKTINITNGVSVKDNPIATSSEGICQSFKIVFVGQLHIWTGIDRLLKGMARYVQGGCRHGNVEVHIVGDGPMLIEWQCLAAELSLETEVIYYGNCCGEVLDAIYNGSHVAIGNLANHRRKLIANADLKNREYCMRGIPFITTAEDRAFPRSFEFLKQVSPADSDINIEEIILFYEAVSRTEPNFKKHMREYAITNLTWETTMRPVIQDIQELIQ